ncbi:MAG TPA: hypothetical protein VMY78_09520 [Solirubrobacteraceae bacterium]|nr:hypothetical protein [Solirubrobacteraceae bacterium]
MTLSRRLLGAFFLASGTLHFARPEIYERIMPDYLPAHRELVLASGAAELAGAAAVACRPIRRAGGWWLVAVLVAIFPANVHMTLHPDRYPAIPRWLLWARLPLQPMLVVWALRATRRES